MNAGPRVKSRHRFTSASRHPNTALASPITRQGACGMKAKPLRIIVVLVVVGVVGVVVVGIII
eukprot:264992-Pyramimonas_sp.AAC.2